VVDAVGSRARVIGVQSAAAPAAHHSWRAGRPVQGTTTTAAEGLATRTAFSLPQQMMRHHLDDFLLVDDEELWQATGELVGTTRSLVEPAAAAGLAGAKRLRDDLAGARIVLMVTGANISPDQLRGVV
jgi:threonine dehydratase